MSFRQTLAGLAELQDLRLRLSPPRFEGRGVLGVNSAGALCFVPLGVDLVAGVAEARKCFCAQIGKFRSKLGVLGLHRGRERTLASSAALGFKLWWSK